MASKLALGFIRLSRRAFRNTWVHKLPVTTWLYRRIFSLARTETPVVAFREHVFRVDPTDITMVPTLISGEYESLELDTFESLLGPGMTFLDVGANIGVYSISASEAIGPSGRIFAFEPVPSNVALLQENINLNAIGNVEIVPKAMGNKPGRARMYLEENSMGTHSLGGMSDRFIVVDVSTLDQFAHENGLKVDLVKIDVEGYEGYVLEGARETVASRPILLMEFSAALLRRSGYNPDLLAEFLLESYPHCFIIDERNRQLRRAISPGDLTSLYNGNLLLTTVEP